MNRIVGLFLLFAILTSVFAESMELVSPEDGYSTQNKIMSLSFYYNSSGSDYDQVQCAILLDGSPIATSPITNAFSTYTYTNTSPLSPATYSWEVLCNQINSTTLATLTGSLSSAARTFTIDPTPATLDLISPTNNYHTASQSNEFKFKYSPKDTGPSSPTCYLDVGVSRIAQTTAIDDSDSSISASLSFANHYWRITCISGAFTIQTPQYLLSIEKEKIVEVGIVGSGGGSVSKPYYRNITEPKPITGPLMGPLNNSILNSSQTNSENIPLPPISLAKAVLTAAQRGTIDDKITLRALTPSGQPITNAQIHIINPQNDIIYITTGNDGTADFSAKMDGLYMYKMPDFELEFLPTTTISPVKNIEAPTAAAIISEPTTQNNYEVTQAEKSNDNAWLFWGGISVLFIVASFLVLMRFSND